jgi:hypothetical protein
MRLLMDGQRKLTGHVDLAEKVGCEVQKMNERDITFCESTKTICGGAGIRNEEGRGDTDTS